MVGRVNFRAKLILSYIFLVLLPFLFIAFFLDKALEENSLDNLKTSLATEARLAESRITPEMLAGKNIAPLEDIVIKLAEKARCRVTVIDASGNVLADSEKNLEEIAAMENHIGRPEIRTALEGSEGVDMRYSPTLKINMLYAAVPIEREEGVPGVVRLAIPVESVNKTLFSIRKTIFMGLLFAVILALALGFIVAARTMSPINRMIQVSRKFAEGDFSRRIVHISKDEIGDLAATLNKMAQDLENKINQIRSQGEKLSAVFNSMAEGVLVMDKYTRIISVNPTIEKIFGRESGLLEGQLFLEAIRNKDISELINNVLKTGEPEEEEINLFVPVRKIFRVNAAPIFEKGKIGGCVAVIHDVTDMRKLETMRKDFVANVSHELKTPLTSIKGFVETLLEGAVDDRANNRKFLNIIREHSERLEKLVDDLLSLSSLESKEIPLEKSEYDLKRQADEIISIFSAQAKKKNISIKNELKEGLKVKADKNKIDQVFTNLIDNAVKFNRENGCINVLSEERAGGKKVIIKDSGTGIPEKDIPRIFERFYRVDKARSRSLGGTGLGLSIVKHIVELHGGSVGVESVEGMGSGFWFILPD